MIIFKTEMITGVFSFHGKKKHCTKVHIPLKNFGWFQNFGGNTNVNRVSFVGWWLVGGWLVVGCVFFLHTPISELTIYPSYTRPKGLAPLGKR